MCVLLYSKAAVQDVLHAGKVCLLDIDMQVNETPKVILYCLRTCRNIKLFKQMSSFLSNFYLCLQSCKNYLYQNSLINFPKLLKHIEVI